MSAARLGISCNVDSAIWLVPCNHGQAHSSWMDTGLVCTSTTPRHLLVARYPPRWQSGQRLASTNSFRCYKRCGRANGRLLCLLLWSPQVVSWLQETAVGLLLCAG